MSKYYVGACIDLERRLYEHNIGHSKFTSLGMPWKLCYKEEFEDLLSAKQVLMKYQKLFENLNNIDKTSGGT